MDKKSRKEKTKLNNALSDILESEFDIYLKFHQIDTVIDVIEYYKKQNMQDLEWVEIAKELRTKKKSRKETLKLGNEDTELKKENERLKKIIKNTLDLLSDTAEENKNRRLKTS